MSMRPQCRFDIRGRWLAAGCLLAALLAGCEKEKPPAPPPPPPEVVVAAVSQQVVPIVLELSGTIEAIKNVQIIPRVSGYIDERYFTEGSFVDKDAPLYLIDPLPFEQKLARLQAQLKGQQANLEFWTSERKRYDSLSKQGAASKERAEGTRAKLNGAMADIEETNAQIRNAELDLGYTKINAPFHGRVQRTEINVGNLVKAQVDVLTQLVQMDPVYIVFSLSRSQTYDFVRMQKQGRAFDNEDMVFEVIMPDGEPYPNKGRLNYVSLLIDPTTDSVTARAVLENTKSGEIGYALIPGQYVPVRATVGSISDALVIPRKALVETQAGTHVYVVGDDNKVEQRMVKGGASLGALLVVEEGLKEGEKVVVDGTQKVKGGIEVKLTAAATPAKAAAKTPAETTQ